LVLDLYRHLEELARHKENVSPLLPFNLVMDSNIRLVRIRVPTKVAINGKVHIEEKSDTGQLSVYKSEPIDYKHIDQITYFLEKFAEMKNSDVERHEFCQKINSALSYLKKSFSPAHNPEIEAMLPALLLVVNELEKKSDEIINEKLVDEMTNKLSDEIINELIEDAISDNNKRSLPRP